MSAQPRCPKCGAELRPEYVRCPFCGEWLPRTQPPPPTWPAPRRRSRAPLVIGIIAGVLVLGAIAAAVVLLLTRSSAHGPRAGTEIADRGLAAAEVERVLQRCGFEVVDSLPQPPEPSGTPKITREGVRIIARAQEQRRWATLAALLEGIEIRVKSEGQEAVLTPDQLGEAILAAAGELSEDDGPLACAIRELALV